MAAPSAPRARPVAGPPARRVRATGAVVRKDPTAKGAGHDQAAELLLAFARLLRVHRHRDELPRRIQDLLGSGFLAPRHVGALAVIAMEGPLSVSALASREGLALSTASLMVTQLSQAGLVERREDAHDRRRTVVSVAPAYRRDSEAALESKLAPLRRALERMGSRRATALLQGLAILVEEISRAGAAGAACSHVRPDPEKEGTA
ncbi:MAG: MarR family winged helix-turn-helix transcriptional regulator [Acidimicrobiales bacterium]